MAEVKLKGGEVAMLDEEDLPLVVGRSCSAGVNKNMVYVRSGRDYLHRLVMRAGPGQIVDHINGNGLDNRRENLRFTTAQGNKANSHFGRYTSRFVGVSLERRLSARPYKASAKADGKNKTIGRFATEEEAARAYDAFVRARHGAKVITNFTE